MAVYLAEDLVDGESLGDDLVGEELQLLEGVAAGDGEQAVDPRTGDDARHLVNVVRGDRAS